MFWNCDKISDDVYQWYCAECYAPIGTENRDFLEWCMKNKERPLCFDCEGVVMETPDMFKDYWEYTWFLLSPETEFTTVMEFSPTSGLLDCSVVMVDKDHWFSKTAIEYPAALRRRNACPVVHISRRVRNE